MSAWTGTVPLPHHVGVVLIFLFLAIHAVIFFFVVGIAFLLNLTNSRLGISSFLVSH
jgi:hypothetical protein